jgi:hypothetical protein
MKVWTQKFEQRWVNCNVSEQLGWVSAKGLLNCAIWRKTYHDIGTLGLELFYLLVRFLLSSAIAQL